MSSCTEHGHRYDCAGCVREAAKQAIKRLQAEITDLEQQVEALKAEKALMDEKARVSFNSFWNGGWYEVATMPRMP